MAKLSKATAKKVDDSQSSFDPVDEGWYHVRLRDVDADRSGPAGPYWSWEYEIVGAGAPDGDDYATPMKNRRLWNNTTLAEGKMFGLNQTFAAFGVPSDTDTDDLCGQIVKAQVTHRTIQKGARTGEIGEQISRLAKADEEFQLPEGVSAGASSGATDPDDVFG
jgi:hypothetical protein